MASPIKHSVGLKSKGCKNEFSDVVTVQLLLSQYLTRYNKTEVKLPVAHGDIDQTTIKAIKWFQRNACGLPFADGKVDPNGPTIKFLNLELPPIKPALGDCGEGNEELPTEIEDIFIQELMNEWYDSTSRGLLEAFKEKDPDLIKTVLDSSLGITLAILAFNPTGTGARFRTCDGLGRLRCRMTRGAPSRGSTKDRGTPAISARGAGDRCDLGCPLQIVDEWGAWNEDWHLDPAYRWLLAYGYHDDLDGDMYTEFCERIRKAFQDILKSYADTKDILVIYVGGDDVGHRWSAECMDEKLSDRMLEWI